MALRNSAHGPAFKDELADSTTSELLLADEFERYLRNHAGGRAFPHLTRVYREVPGIQGIADFVGVRADNWRRHSARLNRQFSDLPRGPSAELIYLLRRPQSRSTLVQQSSYTPGVVGSALAKLVDAGVAMRDKDDIAHLSPRFLLPQFKLYFFEIKISKWQRALGQAIQAKTYANKVFCVFPAGTRVLPQQNRLVFGRLGVGVLL